MSDYGFSTYSEQDIRAAYEAVKDAEKQDSYIYCYFGDSYAENYGKERRSKEMAVKAVKLRKVW